MANRFEMTAEQMQALSAQSLSLYEARLSHAGPYDNESREQTFARMWASSCVAEAMCVLECVYGIDEAERMVTAMLESNAGYRGPRMKRVRM